MKIRNLITALGASALLVAGTTALADDHDDSNSMLSMMHVKIKTGHASEFRAAHAGYKACLEENGADGWSAWRNVGDSGLQYLFVAQMDGWAELDSPDEAGQACWPEHGPSVMTHIESYHQRFARRMADWSGDAEGYTVVRLHHFRVNDGSEFRDAVSEITSILKAAEYEHLGTWYDMIGSDTGESDYFVVSHYENFAAMDEDRKGPYNVVKDAVGEERADELWDQFGDALRDDWEYRTDVWHRQEDMSYSTED